ncbi:MAG: hypothetical protein ACLPQ6_03270 [Steroidobacteraceae bacterium]
MRSDPLVRGYGAPHQATTGADVTSERARRCCELRWQVDAGLLSFTPQGNQQGNQQQPTQCPGGISGNFTAQQGLFGDFETKIRGLSVQAGLNFVSYNTPLYGQPYLSQGFNLSIGAGAVRVGFSYQATSTNGGLSFQPSATNFSFWDVTPSQSGLDYDLSLGVGSGFSINLHATPAGTCPAPGK